jgi:serine/threonine-protein kinase
VRAVGIERWSGTSGAVRVAADGTGPVRLRITYTRRDGDEAQARTVRQETRTLRGETVYTSTVTHDPGDVACGERAYLGILVMTEPASGNGPQVSEAAVDGPACPAPTPTRSAEQTPAPTPTEGRSTSAIGTPAPASPEPTEDPLARPSAEPALRPHSSPGEEAVPEPEEGLLPDR